MNWVKELCDLYDQNQDIVGIKKDKIIKTKKGEERIPLILLPVGHTTVLAQIAVVIDERGTFLRAGRVAEDDRMTIIPVTEESGSRTAGKAPHPYCDNLKYLAGDYQLYCEKETDKDSGEYHKLYIEALRKWKESPFTHGKVNALYQYLSKGSLIRDLLDAGVLTPDENGKVASEEKINGVFQPDAFVRFRIERIVDCPENILAESAETYNFDCWRDHSLQQSFIDYYKSVSRDTDLCYLTGERTTVSYLHSKKIRNEGDGAKLISANDKENFTFRGRFVNRNEAFAIGYEASQKAHNALKWIIRKQGHNWDGLCVVAWESHMKDLPELYKDTDAIIHEVGGMEDGWGEDETQAPSQGTGDMEANRLAAALEGYRACLEPDSRMVLLAFDAATTGRLSMTENISLETSNYLERIRRWHEECRWFHTKWKDNGVFSYMGVAGFTEITEALYGTEQNGMISLNGKNRMYAEVYKRLSSCILENRGIPVDMVELAIRKASSPMSYEKRQNWEKVLAIACSFIKKHKFERNKEVWEVALDKQCRKRSYLYGRLLAVADRIEYRTYDKDEKRQTNAKRYMAAFSQAPYYTWKVIEEKLEPYTQRLSLREAEKYNQLLEKIYDLFDVESFSDNRCLDGLYLLGFHSQALELNGYVKHDEKEEDVKHE